MGGWCLRISKDCRTALWRLVQAIRYTGLAMKNAGTIFDTPVRVDLTSPEGLRALARDSERAFDVAVQEALLQHKLLGHTVVYARDGKPVEVPPWDIEVDASVLTPELQEMARRANIMWADKRRAG
jgi:hypothetical protein